MSRKTLTSEQIEEQEAAAQRYKDITKRMREIIDEYERRGKCEDEGPFFDYPLTRIIGAYSWFILPKLFPAQNDCGQESAADEYSSLSGLICEESGEIVPAIVYELGAALGAYYLATTPQAFDLLDGTGSSRQDDICAMYAIELHATKSSSTDKMKITAAALADDLADNGPYCISCDDDDVWYLMSSEHADALEALLQRFCIFAAEHPYKGDSAQKRYHATIRKFFSYIITGRVTPPTMPTNYALALREGLASSALNRQALITDLDYRFALTPKPNTTAYITWVPDDIMQTLTFERGRITSGMTDSVNATLKRITDGKTLEDVNSIDLPLLRQLYTALRRSTIDGTSNGMTVTVYVPQFCAEMGIDVRTMVSSSVDQDTGVSVSDLIDNEAARANSLFAKLNAFKNCVGISGDGVVSKILETLEVDPRRNTITFALPYFSKIAREIEQKNIRRTRNGRTYKLPDHSFLIHSTIVKERNKVAVEIVCYLIAGVESRGTTPDAVLKRSNADRRSGSRSSSTQCTYHANCGSIFDACPILSSRINEVKDSSNRNRLLRHAFETAYKLLDTQTDLSRRYLNLKVTPIVPTMSTLRNCTIIITHDGKA